MAKLKTRSVLTPSVTSDFSRESKKVFWKQILPKKTIEYTAKDGSRQRATFDDDYLTDLAKMDGVDSIGFLLADADNRHTMDPERWRGKVTQMEVRDDGLYGKFEFPSAKLAKAVIHNPELGVSARIREGISKDDGRTVSRGIIHVLGTLDPQVSGMSPWQTADLSASDDEVLDLSNEKFEEGKTMAGKNKSASEKKALAEYTEADIDAMDETALDAFLAEFAPEFDAKLEGDESDDPEDEESEGDEDEHAEGELVGAGAELSKTSVKDIELANSAAQAASARATEALKRAAAAEWRETRSAYLAAGVPPHLLDLASPVLNRPDEMVIDLSNTNDDDVNVSEIVRGLLDAAKGTIDLSSEQGHESTFRAGDGDDPDAELLAAWKIN